MMKVQEKTGIYLFTVDNLEGYEIVEYYGLVTGRAIYGANFVKDFFARIADTIGGRASGYERALEAAMEESLTQLAEKANRQGANAVMGIDLDTTAMGPRMLMASCSGTAVKIRPVPASHRLAN
jgi:uncharacterized protein YbjQ (UPF0145 family)